MNWRLIHLRALALCLTLGGVLQLPATAGRELPPEVSTASVQPIEAVEPMVVLAPPPKKWRMNGSLSASATYNDNIFISSLRKEDDFSFTVSPSISLTAGSPNSEGAGYFTLNYAPGFMQFLNHSSESAISQSAQFTTGYRFTRLTANLSLGYHKGREADAEVGTRVDRRNYSAALTSSYELTDRSSIDLNLSKSFADYDGFLDVSDTTVQSYFNSRFTEAFTLGLGVAYGSAQAEGSGAQAYEQVTTRAAYTATDQLSFSANAGIDLRDGELSPIFGVSAIYKPFDCTDINLSGSRSIVPSAVFTQQDKELTSLFFSVRQRFLQRYFLTSSIGYDHTDFRGSTQGASESRSDDSISFGLSAATEIREGWSVQLFYQYRRNTSTSEGFSFTNNQVGLSSSVTF